MPRRRRAWNEYPVEFLTVLKAIATTPPPILFGPFTLSDAQTFRRSFYQMKESLREEQQVPDSHPARLSEAIEKLSSTIKPSGNLTKPYNVIFVLHPMTAVAAEINPEAAQLRELAQSRFIVAQRPAKVSEPIFSDEEMRDRLDDIEKDR